MINDVRATDAADLRRALELVRGVAARHPHEVGFPLLAAIQQVESDVRVVTRYVGYEFGVNEESGRAGTTLRATDDL